MKIKPGESIGGQRALRLRDVLRQIRNRKWRSEDLARRLKITQGQVRSLITRLRTLGYIERVETGMRPLLWRLTVRGNAFANAKGGPSVSRAAADREIEGFLGRVKGVNTNPHYLYRVKKVVLFGSYLSDKEELGDIDLAITLEPKESDPDRHFELMKERSREAAASGRQFSDFFGPLEWPQNEVLRCLKGRSRSLSLHWATDGVLKTAIQRVIHQ